MDLTVIIPVYNTKIEYLNDCINSLMRQKNVLFDVILVDDGSATEIANICDDIANKYENINVFHVKNSGVSHARNIGISNVIQSKYIVFLDSDDFIEDNCLYELVKHLEKENCDMAQCNHYYYYPKKTTKRLPITNNTFFVKDEQNFVLNLITPYYSKRKNNEYYGAIRGVWGKVFKTSIIKENNILFDVGLSIGEDAIFVFDYIQHCDKITFFNEYLWYYRENPDSANRRKNDKIDEYRFKLLKTYTSKFEKYKHEKDFYNCILRDILSCYVAVFQKKIRHMKKKERKIYLDSFFSNDFFTNFNYEIIDYSFFSIKEKVMINLIKNKKYRTLLFLSSFCLR